MTTAEIARKLAELRREHRRLDEDIAIAPARLDDELQLKRMKKRKLQLKDQIAQLEAQLVPDEPA